MNTKYKRIPLEADENTIIKEYNSMVELINIGQKTPEIACRYYYVLGRLKVIRNEFDEAIEAFRNCGRTVTQYGLPEIHEIFFWYAKIDEINGQLDQAKMYYQCAIDNFHDDPTYISKAEIIKAMGLTNEPPKTETLADIFKKYSKK